MTPSGTSIYTLPTNHKSGCVEGHIQIACLLQSGPRHWTQTTLTSPILQHTLELALSHPITCCSWLKSNKERGERSSLVILQNKSSLSPLAAQSGDSEIIGKSTKREVRLNWWGEWQAFTDDNSRGGVFVKCTMIKTTVIREAQPFFQNSSHIELCELCFSLFLHKRKSWGLQLHTSEKQTVTKYWCQEGLEEWKVWVDFIGLCN